MAGASTLDAKLPLRFTPDGSAEGDLSVDMGVPVSIGTGNSEGDADNVARGNHVHKHPTLNRAAEVNLHHNQEHADSVHTGYTPWRLPYIGGTGAEALAGLGANGTFLESNGAAAAPAFRALVVGDIPGHGPSQHTEGTAWRLTYLNASGDETEIVLGANGTFLESNGASAAPAFRALAAADLSDFGSSAIAAVEGEATLVLTGGSTEIKLLNLTDATELTLDTNGDCARTQTQHIIDTFEDAGTDDLNHVTGGAEGDALVLQLVTTAHKITIKHNVGGVGSFVLPGAADILLDTDADRVFFIKRGAFWYLLGFSFFRYNPLGHGPLHQNGGAQEISVAGLSGLLADDQHVLDTEALAAAKAGAGIADGDLAQVDGPGAGAPASGEYAKWTASGLEGKSYAEVLSDLSGQAAANFAMNSKKITGLAAATANGDAVRYEQLHTKYLNSEAIAAVEGEATLDLAGDVTIAANKSLTVDTSTLFVDGVNHRVGIGTTTVPAGGIGPAKLEVVGAYESLDGPHVQLKTTNDDYPLFGFLGWRHDYLGIYFDCYRVAGADQSSDAGSNFRLLKYNDYLRIYYASGHAQGANVSFSEALTISTAGQVALPAQGSGGGLLIGADTNLYRSVANVLKTDDAFHAAGGLKADTLDELTAAAGITLDGVLLKDGRAQLSSVAADPGYVDGKAILYFYSSAGTDELRVRGKVGATETQVTLADITP